MQDNKITEEQELREETTVDTETTESAENKEEKAKAAKNGDKKKIKKLETELEEATKRADEINEKYMRMLAEYDNFRKRSAKEKEGVYGDACADVLTAILPVLDNLERAEACKDAEGLAKGLELTLKSFRETLEKMGVQEIDAVGKTFDPNLHNAVMHEDNEERGENEITDVLMKGYTKGDRVIRYAMVKVAN